MPKKTKRPAQQRRRPAPTSPADAGSVTPGDDFHLDGFDPEVGTPRGAAPAGLPGIGDPPRAAAVAVGRKRIGRVDPGADQGRRGRIARPGGVAAQFEPLDPGDAAIPFDRVPYVPSDLRRVAVIASLMVAIIIVAAVVVSHFVK